MGTCIKNIENLLIQGEWRKADIETEKLIFSFYNSKKNSWLTPEDIDFIPLDTLACLEMLWTTYSQGRFGFRVQEQVHNRVRDEVRNNPRDSIKRIISNVLHGTNNSMSDKEVLMVPYFFGVEVGWIEGHPMDFLGAYGREKNYEDLTFDLSAPIGHLPCKTWWTLNQQAKRISIEALFKKYGILGISGCLIKYMCSVELHFFKRVRIACQQKDSDERYQFTDKVISDLTSNPLPPQESYIPPSTQRGIQLKSAMGIDYTRLNDLLAVGKWKDADKETAKFMLVVAGREKEGWLREEDIYKIPCEDLHIIDQLWVKYSNGCFGFSVQKRIYLGLAETQKYDWKIWEAFAERVGWKNDKVWLNYNNLTFNLQKTSEGELPALCLLDVIGGGGKKIFSLVSRLVNCNIQN